MPQTPWAVAYPLGSVRLRYVVLAGYVAMHTEQAYMKATENTK